MTIIILAYLRIIILINIVIIEKLSKERIANFGCNILIKKRHYGENINIYYERNITINVIHLCGILSNYTLIKNFFVLIYYKILIW